MKAKRDSSFEGNLSVIEKAKNFILKRDSFIPTATTMGLQAECQSESRRNQSTYNEEPI